MAHRTLCVGWILTWHILSNFEMMAYFQNGNLLLLYLQPIVIHVHVKKIDYIFLLLNILRFCEFKKDASRENLHWTKLSWYTRIIVSHNNRCERCTFSWVFPIVKAGCKADDANTIILSGEHSIMMVLMRFVGYWPGIPPYHNMSYLHSFYKIYKVVDILRINVHLVCIILVC